MAKKQKGYYSPEAIQSRQQSELEAYQATQKPQKETTLSGDSVIPPTQGVSPIPTAPKVNINNPPKPPPYMAFDETSGGLAYYGDGFKGWLRKTWADLTDPSKFKWQFNQLDRETQSELSASYDDSLNAWSRVLDEKIKWSDWGQGFFGLSSKDLAALPAGIQTEVAASLAKSEAEGDTNTEAAVQLFGTGASRSVRLAVDTTQNLMWGGLSILGLDDTVVRKTLALTIGLDTVADQFAKDEETSFFKKLTQTGAIAVGRDIFVVANAVRQNKITWAETGEVLNDYQKGSQMAYTLIFDNAKRAEFEKARADGKDLGFMAQELGNIGTELAGSVLGSPSTYLGLSIVKPALSKTSRLTADTVRIFGKEIVLPWKTMFRTPTFGEIIGAEIGRVRLANAGKRFTNNVMPELDTLLRNPGNLNDEKKAGQVIDRALNIIKTKFDDQWNQKSWLWNLSSVDNDGKVRRISADADYFIKAMMTRFGLNETLAALQDMVNLRAGGNARADAAKKLLTKSDMVFSDVGMMVGEIMNRLDGDDLLRTIKKSTNHQETHGLLYRKLEEVVGELIPSVEDMMSAERRIKAGESTPRLQQLAEMAKELPTAVRKINQLTRPSEVITKKTTSGMVQLFMNLVPRTWARNIYGQFLMTAMATDLPTAFAVSLEAFTTSPLRKISDNLLEGVNNAIIKRLGFTPIEASLGVGDALKTTKTRYGFLPWMQRSEQQTAAHIVLKVADQEIKKALPAVVKDMQEYNDILKLFPKDQQGLLYSALYRSGGNVDDAINVIRKVAGTGEVEAWRFVQPSMDMQNHLSSLNMLDDFYSLQNEAKSVDEFQAGLQAFISKYDDIVTKAAEGLPSTSSKMPPELYKFAEDISDTKKVDIRDKNLMAELIQSWQNTQDQLTTVVSDTLKQARRIALEDTAGTGNAQLGMIVEKATDRIEAAANITTEQFRSINTLRDEIWNIHNALDGATPADLKALWGKPIVYKGHTFRLNQIYQSQDLSKLDASTFKKKMWTAFYETTADLYRHGNNKKYSQSLQALEDMATEMGLSLEAIAGADKGGNNPFRVLATMYQEAEEIEDAFSWRRFLRQFNFEEVPKNADGSPALLKDVIGDFQSVFPTWKGGKSHIVAAVAKDTGKAVPYEQVTLEQAWKAIWNRTRVPPFDETVTDARILWETRDGFLSDVTRWGDEVVSEWGTKMKSTPVDMTPQLQKFKAAFNTRMQPVREVAGRVAVETRNFVLHDYDKTYMDHALTYLFGDSFHYWTTQTYSKMVENVVDNPKYANTYLAYKEYLQKEHADMPDYYRQNMVVTNLLGIDLSNPYYVNLESMINPVYAMTGTDFNDPKKRVDWVTNMVSDMGQIGPSFSPLINWAIALKLYTTGQSEAGERWLGRALPQSQVVKSASSTFFGEAIEIDPFVQIANQDLWGGTDPYERNRVVAALAMMVQNGEITQEQMIEASRSKQGDIWNTAVNLSAQKRFSGDVASFFIGAGARPRTQQDMVIEKFWNDYSTLLATKSLMTPDEYRQAWDEMRDNPEYGMFMDGLLLGRKNSADIETAYAYNVLSRIPPGQTSEITKLLDINPVWVEEFYNAKGDITKMNISEQDKKRFIAGIEDMALMYKLPNGANRQEWTQAKNTYSSMKTAMNDRYGEDIQDKLQAYYDLDYSAREDYLDDNPIVRDALILQDYYITTNPMLAQYYGGFNTMERYYTNVIYRDLEKKYGEDARNLDLEYSELLTKEERKAFESQHPGFKTYLAEKKKLLKEMDAKLSEVPFYLPPSPASQGNDAFGDYQQALLNASNIPQVYPIEFWQQSLGNDLVEVMADSYMNGESLPYYARQELEYQAQKLGMNVDEALAYFNTTMSGR